MTRPNRNPAIRLGPQRPRPVSSGSLCVVRTADGAAMGYGDLESCERLRDALGWDGFEIRLAERGAEVA